MKSKTFVMMFLAIGCGLVAAYLTARISAKQAAPDTLPVLVAKDKILAGQVIKEPEKLFVLMSYPAGSTPNAISNFDDLKNKIVSKSVQPGQWLTPDDLSGNFGIELPKGFYAVSVKVDPSSAGSGFILPKSRVNVVATIKGTGVGAKQKVVTILQDVLVLAIDTMSVRPDDKLAVGQMSTALLAVKPADSQKIKLAQSMGEVSLVLRAHDDETKAALAPQEYLDADSLAGTGFEGAQSPAAIAAAAAAAANKVKLAVAKRDLEAGTVIDNPDNYFEIKGFADSPSKAIAADELKSLKGRTIRHSVFKDTVLTAKHFEGDEVPPVVKAPEQRDFLFIQNGGQAPAMIAYKNGVMDIPDAMPAKADAGKKSNEGEK